MASLKVSFQADAKDLTKALLDLPVKVRKKVLRPALKAGAKVVLPQALANAPLGKTSTLLSSIDIRPGKASAGRRGILSVTIETGRDARGFAGRAFYGAFQEFGWTPGKRIGRNSRWRVMGGKVEGKHYLERAFESKKAQASAVVLAKLKRGLERAASKGG